MSILYLFNLLLCFTYAQSAFPNDDTYKYFIHVFYLFAA
jgi:hypothetical protein